MKQKRPVEVVVISDVHLGTYGSRAGELLAYLHSIDPRTIVLNGDIIDIWQFNKRYFPPDHLKVIKHLLSLVVKGKEVIYVAGNHDELMRRFRGFDLAGFKIVNKVVLELDGKRAWVFHGDVFDVTMKHSRWLARLGGIGYDFLIRLNTVVNACSHRLGRGRISLSKRIKSGVKRAIRHIDDFETTAARIAMSNGYEYVVCGHIHQPQHRVITDERGRSVTYLNSGDWIENLTALEYDRGRWSLYEHGGAPVAAIGTDPLDTADLSHAMIFQAMVEEFQLETSS
ncbi:UDP-2,3-diacylglucosamine pyrophosphatase LpxH [Neolewinella xylanilytica]|uniref:UDP-2,3-diacylglucosamine pyrophosphatase LpxH n=1 Tax=Neolewinella xylanilytica TaxID=1514080 RepID=A0A2S6I9J9_9BACT|nr:UDP-2,3-diacylglucosamine diphosphatase [Neolewinella xylanilytica]PPK88176.1 UDP-2,3-diacylglucosamine pyrophosphatase LpxH [Neolewinella xylanilytica]